MKTYISSLIPKIQQYSERLDNVSLLTNKHWVIIDDIMNLKTVYIFRPNNDLLISENGKVTKGKWEYIGGDSILIDVSNSSYLFKQGFFDDNVLALKIDGANEYAILVNEINYINQLTSILKVDVFLKEKYVSGKKLSSATDQTYTKNKKSVKSNASEVVIKDQDTKNDLVLENGKEESISNKENTLTVYILSAVLLIIGIFLISILITTQFDISISVGIIFVAILFLIAGIALIKSGLRKK